MNGVLPMIWLVALGFAAVAYVLAIALAHEAAHDKGYEMGGRVWLIGLFLTPILAGILVAALPDKRARELLERNSRSS